jgi:ribosomal protein L10
MVTVEVYISKKDDVGNTQYKILNTKGIGIEYVPKVQDFTATGLAGPTVIDGVVGGTSGATPYTVITNADIECGEFVTGDLIDKVIGPLRILVNRKELKNFDDYYIDVNNNLYLVKPMKIGDKLEIHDVVVGDNWVATSKNSYNPNALIKLFSSDTKYKYNQEYTFKIGIKDEEEKKSFSESFQSQYDPFYSNVKNIRLDTGDLLDGATDAQISKLIYKWSKDAYQILNDDNRLDDIKKYKYTQNYVRYKTDIDLCYAIYCSISGKYGVITKEVGNIKVQREVKLPLIAAMIKRFEDLLRPNEDLLHGNKNSVVSFVKAGNTAYTVPNRGVF